MSDGSFKSLVKENLEDDGECLRLDVSRVLAFSDNSFTSLSGIEGCILSGGLGGTFMPLSADSRLRCKESSAEETAAGPGVSEGTRAALGVTVGCLLSSEGLRRLGDWSPLGVAAATLSVGVGGKWSEPEPSTGASETTFTGDLTADLRSWMDGRPGATLGLIANRFRLWTASEELTPSPFCSLLSLRYNK